MDLSKETATGNRVFPSEMWGWTAFPYLKQFLRRGWTSSFGFALRLGPILRATPLDAISCLLNRLKTSTFDGYINYSILYLSHHIPKFAASTFPSLPPLNEAVPRVPQVPRDPSIEPETSQTARHWPRCPAAWCRLYWLPPPNRDWLGILPSKIVILLLNMGLLTWFMGYEGDIGI